MVASRRAQWDSLLWQVPVLSLTAQAFLFTISLGSGTSPTARILASSLSIIVTLLCTTLMARHRQNEIADAAWLNAYEQREWNESVHAGDFRSMRDRTLVDGGWAELLIPGTSGTKTVAAFKAWVLGLSLFGLASALAIILTVVDLACGTRILSSSA